MLVVDLMIAGNFSLSPFRTLTVLVFLYPLLFFFGPTMTQFVAALWMFQTSFDYSQ